ncbi:MAG: hypothetical protein K0R54_5288 [Clostridiaceae bacterium]|nr:hypothetical protein [Clostridiaceae bacterium]
MRGVNNLLNKVNIIIIIIVTCFLLKELFIANYRGKHIIKPDERRNLAISWIIFLILWSLFLIIDIRKYVEFTSPFYGEFIESNAAMYGNFILQHALWVELCILNFMGAIRYSEIREKGIYNYLYFYKWDKIKSYSWISPDIIQFKVTIFKKINRKFTFTIVGKNDILKMDEILKRYITS